MKFSESERKTTSPIGRLSRKTTKHTDEEDGEIIKSTEKPKTTGNRPKKVPPLGNLDYVLNVEISVYWRIKPWYRVFRFSLILSVIKCLVKFYFNPLLVKFLCGISCTTDRLNTQSSSNKSIVPTWWQFGGFKKSSS